MKQKLLLATMKTCLLALGATSALLFTSCAQDDFEDESFSSDVRDTQLLSPSADEISFTANADGSRRTISWPLVKGARGFEVKVKNVNNPDETIEVVDSIVDGYSLTMDVEEDTNYLLTIRTLANTSIGNKDAAEATVKTLSTFSPTYAVIPAETDLYTYFHIGADPENPKNLLPDTPLGKELCFDLVPGGQYTISGPIDFGGHHVTLRTQSKTNHAKITMQKSSTFTTFAPFGLKNVDIDATDLNKSIVTMSDTPNDSIKDLIETKGVYFVMEPILFQGCNIKSLNYNILSNNSVKYNLRTVMVSDCVIEINGESSNTSGFVYMKAGFITDFSAKNSTIYATAHSDKFFMQIAGRPKDINETELRYTTITNCTLANIAWSKNFCDYHNGQKTYYYTLRNCIILDCGKPNFVTGLNKGQDSENPTWDVDNNTFWRAGADVSAKQMGDDPSSCKWLTNNKGSNTVVTTDPEIDPTIGDFVPAAAQQAAGQGDPRWYTAE